VKLYRFSAFYGNPWGRLYLAEALELGEGTARNIAEAIDLYRAAAGQDQAPAAKGLAQDALVRLGATATKQAR